MGWNPKSILHSKSQAKLAKSWETSAVSISSNDASALCPFWSTWKNVFNSASHQITLTFATLTQYRCWCTLEKPSHSNCSAYGHLLCKTSTILYISTAACHYWLKSWVSSLETGNTKFHLQFFFYPNARKKKMLWKQLKRGKEKNPLPICENSMLLGFTMNSNFNEKPKQPTRIACGSSSHI